MRRGMRGPAFATAAALLAPAAKADLLHCHMLMALAAPSLGQVVSAEVEGDNQGCLFHGLETRGLPGDRPALKADRLLIAGDGFEDLIDDGAPLRSLRFEVQGLALLPNADPTLLRWEHVLLAREAPVDITLAYVWDAQAQQVRIEILDLDFGPEGQLRLTGTLDDVDLRDKDMAAISVGGMGLTRLDVAFDSQGLFETLVMPLVAPRLLADFATPEAGIGVLRAAAIDALAKVPPSILDQPSLEALTSFVTSLPQPSGRLRLEMDAAPGLGAPRFFGFAMTGVPRRAEEFWAAFAGVTLKADWAPLN